MNNFPIEIIGEIMQFLDIRTLFTSFSILDHSFYEACTNEYNLSRYLSNITKISQIFSLSKHQIFSLLRQISTPSAPVKLNFTGFATSGGVDEDYPIYWVDQLFTEEGKPYCARENKLNINCAGVLLDTQNDPIKLSTRQEIASFVRNHQKLQEIFHDQIGTNDEDLNVFELSLFKEIWERAQYMIFYGSELSEDEQRAKWGRYKELYMEIRQAEVNIIKYRRRDDDPFVLVKPLSFKDESKRLYAYAKSLIFSREGRMTCPVQTFMIFMSESYVDIESEELALYDNLMKSEDLDALIENDKRVPKAYPLVIEEGCQYRLFHQTKNMLKPIVWGKFNEKEGEKLTVKLRDSFSGVYLYVKLINPENRMAELNDIHEFTNIDARYVSLYGQQLAFDIEN